MGGGHATVVCGDLRSPRLSEKIVNVARSPEDALVTPVLVNCAGVAIFGPYAKFEERDIEETIQVNLLAPMLLINEVLPWMLERGRGHIVNVLSVAAVETLNGAAAYSASKGGLLAFGKGIAAEYRRSGVRVTSLIPGATDTPLWDVQGFQPPREDMLSASALGKIVADIVTTDEYRYVDEIRVMPEKGLL